MGLPTVIAIISALAVLDAAPARAATLEWVRQLGTPERDFAYGVSADGLGNVYIAGDTGGSLGGPNAGGYADAFLAKYDAAGDLLWTRQLGISEWDRSSAVSADRLGNVYITGATESLDGPNAGQMNAFLAKYDAAGDLLWTRQLGTSDPSRWTESMGVSADGLGNVYIAGSTWGSLVGGPNPFNPNAWVAKYDAAGDLLWTRQFFSSPGPMDWTYANAVSADGSGNVYVGGLTFAFPIFGGPGAPPPPRWDNEAFLTKFDAAGNRLWTRQFGTESNDDATAVSADGSGNVYIAGRTEGSLAGPNAGGGDAFLARYDAAGGLLWTRQLGSASWDDTFGVSADDLGNVYIAGRTGGSLAGPNAGGSDAWVANYDAAGDLLWTRQFGSTWGEYDGRPWPGGSIVSADGLGNVYIAGDTRGSLGGANAGLSDAFVAKYGVPVPEPSTWALAGTALAYLATIRRIGHKAATVGRARPRNPGRRTSSPRMQTHQSMQHPD